MAADVVGGMKFDFLVTLEDPGAEPRAVLAYRPRPGATVTFEAVSSSQSEGSVTMPGGQTTPMPTGNKTPATVTTTRNTVGDPLPNGIIPVHVEMLGTRVVGDASGEGARAMTDAWAMMKGMSFQVLVDTNGRPVQMDVEGGADPAMAGAMQGLMDQMTAAIGGLPTEPVGVGGKWSVDSAMSMLGMEMKVHATNTLLAVTPDSLDLGIVSTIHMDQGTMQIPGMPPGFAPQITRMTGSGSGTQHIDLTTLVTTGTMTTDVSMDMAIQMPGASGGKMAMTMRMHQSSDTHLAR